MSSANVFLLLLLFKLNRLIWQLKTWGRERKSCSRETDHKQTESVCLAESEAMIELIEVLLLLRLWCFRLQVSITLLQAD